MSSPLVHRPGVATTGLIRQAQRLAFRRLWIDQPTLIVVEAGSKLLQGAAGRLQVAAGEAVALAGGQAVDVSNRPDEGGDYRARWLSFERPLLAQRAPAPPGRLPARAMLSLGRLPAPGHAALVALHDALADAAIPERIACHRAQEMLLWIEAAGACLLLDEGGALAPRVRRLLAGEPAAAWRAARVAAALAMSEASLRRHLAAEGTTLGEILRDLRLSTALTLLQSTGWQVTRIAGEVGYRSPSQFALRFRQRFGMPPTALREAAPACGESVPSP